MSDRIKSITVVLEDNVRDDEAQAIVEAIKCMRRVVSAEANVADIEHYSARMQIRREIGEQLIGVIYPKQQA